MSSNQASPKKSSEFREDLPPVLSPAMKTQSTYAQADFHIDPDGTKTKQLQEQIAAMQEKMRSSGKQPLIFTGKHQNRYKNKSTLEKIQLQLEELEQFETEEQRRKFQVYDEQGEVCIERVLKIKDRSRSLRPMFFSRDKRMLETSASSLLKTSMAGSSMMQTHRQNMKKLKQAQSKQSELFM